MPLFEDAERARIGEIYHQISQGEARLAGLEIAAPRLPRLLRELTRLQAAGRTLLLYCWRGGLRSQAVQDSAALLGLPCLRLAGGYRDYRRWLLAYLEQPLAQPLVTLHGLTGCGKTAVLRKLKRQGLQVLDLEDLARHRGSVFGHIGLAEQPSQKYFQSLLTQELCGLDTSLPLLVECESRRVGRLLLHDTLFAALRAARRILLYDTPAGRARRLLNEYEPQLYREQILQALAAPALSAKFSAARLGELAAQVEAGAYNEVIVYLLLHYYDPLYHYPNQSAPGYDLCVCAADEDLAAAEIKQFLMQD